MATLNHPAIQRGLGSGRFNSTPYLVTELIVGESMRGLCPPGSPHCLQRIPWPSSEKSLMGLAHCHDNKIIHRDLKPENILLTKEGQPVISGFRAGADKRGASRNLCESQRRRRGRPDYMAPEQIEGQRGDQRTDLYALGTMLYELLTGRTPFSGDNNLAVMAQHLKGIVPRLDHEQPNVVPSLAAIVARCLQRDPDDRYTDMHALIQDLDHPENVDVSILEHATGPDSAAPWWRRSPLLMPIGAAFLLLLVIILIAFGLQALR
jgi:serine/threonine protein kinase